MNLRFFLSLIVVILLIILIAFIYMANYFYNLALNPKSPKKMVLEGNGIKPRTHTKEEDWVENESKFEYVHINSFDGCKLYAHQILANNKTHKWAITVHGYMSSAYALSTKALHYYNKGYNVLCLELRSHGNSEGDYIGMGYHDSKDVVKWIEYIISKDKDSEILLHGVSMGGATVMITSGYDLAQNVKVIVEDCGYTSAFEQFKYQLKKLFKIPSFPLLNISDIIVKIRAGYSLKEASPIDSVAKSKTPIIFIHGDKDEFVPCYMLDKVFEKCKSPKKKVIIEGAPHALAEKIDPIKYWNEVDSFIQNYI